MTGPAPAVAAVRLAVRRALVDVPEGSTVLVACSGGPDSLALAAGLAFEALGGRGAPGREVRGQGPRGHARWRAGAVVVDHGLQAGSDEVAARAGATCCELGLDPVLVRRVDATGDGGPEAAARVARYAALDEAARETGAAAVLLGHTLDDQAETVLLGLARGSGPRSLAGMPAVRGVFRRPLLELSRADTEAACRAQGLDPWHDPTNAAGPASPLRSRVRGELMPVLDEVLGPGVTAALARTADLVREQADALDELAAALLTAATATSPALLPTTSEEGGVLAPGSSDVRPGEFVASEEGGVLAPGSSDVAMGGGGWDVDVLAAAPVGVRRAALHAAAVAAGVAAGSLSRSHVVALDALVTGWHGQGPVPLPGGIEGVRRCGRLYLELASTT